MPGQARHLAARDAVFGHYGWGCACCNSRLGVEIDDISASIHPQLRKLGGTGFYRWLIVRNFPPGFQTLCSRCNTSKLDGGYCKLHRKQLAAS